MKKILALLLWLGGSVAFAQSINGYSPSVIAVDGSNATLSKVLTLPQVQATVTYNASATPSPVAAQPTQASNWFPMNGNGAAMVEFSTNAFTGNYSIQVSNNPTPVSTPGTNIQTIVQDTATAAAGGAGAQTKNWDYFIREGWKWIRVIAQPDASTNINTGTLNTQIRLFGNPIPGDASRSYLSGVPWKQSDAINGLNTVLSAAGATPVTTFVEYKLPQTAHGINIYTNVAGVSGASTIVSYVFEKDPTSGQLQQVGAGASTHAANFSSILINPGYSSPYPVATPPTGQTILSFPMAQDIVIGNAQSGTGATTFSQTIVPIE